MRCTTAKEQSEKQLNKTRIKLCQSFSIEWAGLFKGQSLDSKTHSKSPDTTALRSALLIPNTMDRAVVHVPVGPIHIQLITEELSAPQLLSLHDQSRESSIDQDPDCINRIWSEGIRSTCPLVFPHHYIMTHQRCLLNHHHHDPKTHLSIIYYECRVTEVILL